MVLHDNTLETTEKKRESTFLRGGPGLLQAPVLRVTGYDIPYPPATIEQHYVPSVERILAAVERVLTY